MKRLVAALLSLSMMSSSVLAGCEYLTKEHGPKWTRAECPVTCVIRDDPGGTIRLYKNQAYLLKNQGRHLVIDGRCDSACTVAADLARPNVCITRRAQLRFHKAYWCEDGVQKRGDLYEDYSRDISRWVKANGGFPGADWNDDSLLVMNADQASSFFPACS